MYLAAVQSGDVRSDRDIAAAGANEKLAGYGGVRLPDGVLGLGQAVVCHPPTARRINSEPNMPLRLKRQPGPVRMTASIGRPYRYLGMTCATAPRGHDQPCRHSAVAQLARNIHRAIADADHQHPLAVQIVRRKGVDIFVRVDLDAVELTREGGLGPARVPVVAVGHDQHVEGMHLAVVERDPPAAVGHPLGMLDSGVEPDRILHAEVFGIGPKVGGDLRVVREVGIVGRKRKVVKRDRVARRVDVQRAIGATTCRSCCETPSCRQSDRSSRTSCRECRARAAPSSSS